MRVTLLDSSHKKAAFVQQVIAELGLHNTEAVCERVERWQTPQRFELIVSRAFADLSDFYWVGFLPPGDHAFEMLIDPGNVIAESNEADNVYQFNFTVLARNAAHDWALYR